MSLQPKVRKTIKVMTSAALTAGIVAPIVAPASADAAWTNAPSWMTDSLQDLVNYGVIDADSTVNATGEVTRGEVALYFARALKLDMENVTNPNFADVSTSHQYYNAIAALANAGKMNGTEKGFEPDRVINRAEMASLLVKAFGYEYGNGANLKFTDLKGSEWAKNAIAGLMEAGIKLGTSETKFAPTAKLTRQDTAGFLWKVMDNKGIEFTAPVAQFDEVSVVNSNTLLLSGANLAGLTKDQVVVDGNTVTAVVVNEAADEATITFEKKFELNKEQTLTVNLNDEAVEMDFTYEINVDSVKALTTKVDVNDDKQFLQLAINGETAAADVALLKEAGYTVEFQSTNAAIIDANTGEFKEGTLNAGDKFAYKVVISLDDEVVAESSLVEVEVINYSATTTDITKYDLQLANGVAIKSGKIALGETATLTNILGSLLDGTVDQLITVDEFKSSNTSVAVINENGVITPVAPGSVTFTIISDKVEVKVPVTIVADAREAAKVTTSITSTKLVTGATQNVSLTVVDQYGDVVKGFDLAALTVTNADGATIATVADPAATDVEGKTSFVISADATNVGTGVLEVKSGDKKLASINVTIGALGEVSQRKLELQDASKDLNIDLIKGSDDADVALVYNKYNAEGFLMGQETALTSTFTVESSNTDVATVAVSPAGVITVAKGTKTGTATIKVKEGTVVRASINVNVVDTTPTITGITFEKDLKLISSTDTIDLDTELVKPANIKINGDQAVAISPTGIIYINVTGEGYDAEADITLGSIATVSNVKLNNATVAAPITNGAIAATEGAPFAAGSKGEIIVKVTRPNEVVPVATTTIAVDVK